MSSVFEDIVEVGKEGSYELLGFDESKSIMSNIHEHLDQIDQELAQEAGNVVDEVSQFDPGVMWTPLIISAMVMMAIFAMSCCSVCMFCWFIRYRKASKEKQRKAEYAQAQKMADVESQKPVKMRQKRPRSYYDTYYDAETEDEYRRPSRRARPHSQHGRPASKHITMNNFNEETYKIVNHLHRTMSQQREQSFNNSLPRRKRDQEPLYEKSNYTSSSLGDGDSTGWGKYPDGESTGISSIPSPGRGSTPTRKKSSVKESKGRYTKVLSDYGAHLKQKAKDGSHAAIIKSVNAIPSKKLSTGLVSAINDSRRDQAIKKRASSSPKTVIPNPSLEPSAPLTTTTDTFDTAIDEHNLDYHDDFDDYARWLRNVWRN